MTDKDGRDAWMEDDEDSSVAFAESINVTLQEPDPHNLHDK